MKASLILLLTLLSQPVLASENADFSVPQEQANGVERGRVNYDDLTSSALTTGVKAELHRVLKSMNRLSSETIVRVVSVEVRSVAGGDMGSEERLYRIRMDVASSDGEIETLEMVMQEYLLANPPVEKVVMLSVRTLSRTQF